MVIIEYALCVKFGHVGTMVICEKNCKTITLEQYLSNFYLAIMLIGITKTIIFIRTSSRKNNNYDTTWV